jgi:hypothetical protein
VLFSGEGDAVYCRQFIGGWGAETKAIDTNQPATPKLSFSAVVAMDRHGHSCDEGAGQLKQGSVILSPTPRDNHTCTTCTCTLCCWDCIFCTNDFQKLHVASAAQLKIKFIAIGLWLYFNIVKHA